jgi:hypothetical protein
VHRLVYYEMHKTMEAAILREKRLKKWNRAWKLRLIEGMNPEWEDLFDEFWGAISEGPADRSRRHIGRDRVEIDLGPRLRGGDALGEQSRFPRTSFPRRREPSPQSSRGGSA